MNEKLDEILVSIIVPTYNSGTLLEVCLESLLRQTHSKIEIIIVDDGSIDNTLQICEFYMTKDERVHLFRQSHKGVAAARNKGIDVCTGSYITFVDSDDYAEPYLIEEYLSCRQTLCAELTWIMCGMHVNVYCGTMKEEDNVVKSDEKYICLHRAQVAYLSSLKLFNFVTNKMYVVTNLKEHNIRFREKVQIGEDLQFNLDCLNHIAGEMGMVNLPLYHYVRHSNTSLSLVYYENAIEHTKSIYDELLLFAKKQPEITKEDLLTIKAIYIVDWTSRMTALYEESRIPLFRSRGRHIVKKEVCSDKFQELLKEVHACHKITYLRYLALRMKNYGLYCFLRRIYRFIK